MSVENVETLECDCRSIPDKYFCDTVFTSLCPAMNSPGALLPMEKLEKRCACVSSSDESGNSMETEIWRELGCDYSYRGYITEYPRRYPESLGRSPL